MAVRIKIVCPDCVFAENYVRVEDPADIDAAIDEAWAEHQQTYRQHDRPELIRTEEIEA